RQRRGRVRRPGRHHPTTAPDDERQAGRRAHQAEPLQRRHAHRLAGAGRPQGGGNRLPGRADAPAEYRGGRALRGAPGRPHPEPAPAAGRPLLGADQLDGVLMESLSDRTPGANARGLAIDRRAFLTGATLAGATWLTPVGHLLARAAEARGRTSAPARSIIVL